jgi:hypothetical protein
MRHLDIAPDTLVFHVSPVRLSLLGGSGRGAGWSGIVDLPLADEPLAARVHRTSRLARVDAGLEPARIVGPYWARHAALVPVGSDHLVVFGGPEPVDAPDATLVPMAAQLVAALQQVSPAKLLADELEIVHAIRDLMDYRPETVAATARHVALKAAEPLSCEVGAVLVRTGGKLVAEVVTRPRASSAAASSSGSSSGPLPTCSNRPTRVLLMSSASRRAGQSRCRRRRALRGPAPGRRAADPDRGQRDEPRPVGRSGHPGTR